MCFDYSLCSWPQGVASCCWGYIRCCVPFSWDEALASCGAPQELPPGEDRKGRGDKSQAGLLAAPGEGGADEVGDSLGARPRKVARR